MPFAAAQPPVPEGARERVADPERPGRVTLLELFFDLAYVVALALVSAELFQSVSRHDETTHGLVPAISWHQVLHAPILLMALWWVWAITTTTANLNAPQGQPVKLLLPAAMAGVLLMATAVPHAFDNRGLTFALGYVAIHLVRGAILIYTTRHDAPVCTRELRVTTWFTVSGAFWIAGGLVGDGKREACWLIALAIDYSGLRLAYPVPGLGPVPLAQRAVTAEHLSERYQQFFTIALGDCVLVIGTLFSSAHSQRQDLTAFTIAFLTTVLMWRVYVHRSGALLPVAIRMAANPSRFLHTAPYTHLLLVAGVVTTAAGFDLILHNPAGRTPPGWVAVLLGGPAIFLVGRAVFEYEVFSRVSSSRPGGLLVLLALAPWTFFLPPVVTAAAAMLVLAGVAVADTRRSWGRPPEQPAPPA
ncbi:low temperature requirement protein A [Micromonospora cathayae]|uniref:Low temperature requirement protein A n=1 Tax=Micromonospora cathayae TaxID=3028804 RepID=A0ABY7ZJC9_9ACTN|nr:low temperature requirement protein A [Micromonospora sp. HUAS 3]WDZ82982.1 low temperature requirement protein A [Micromonospora sp. HUAS 3]